MVRAKKSGDEVGHFHFSRKGVEVDPGATFDEWKEQLGRMSVTNAGVQWWIGDLLVFGEQQYGEKYEQAMNDFGLAYQTLANMKWVASSVPFSVRREDLTWNHHTVVASIEKPAEQAKWLALAAKEELSVAELKAKVRLTSQRAEAPEEEADEAESAESATAAARYKVILADIPDWGMRPDEIAKLVKVPADQDAVIFIWAPAEHLHSAMVLMDHWGFAYQSCAVWDMQKTANKSWFQIHHQLLLVGSRGDIKSPPPERLSPSVVRARGSKTSGKPEEFYSLIEDAFPARGKKVIRLDLFGETEREGWDLAKALATVESDG